MSTDLAPVALGPNQPPRFYRGGAAIARLRGTVEAGGNHPEDWVASTTTLYGEARAGLSALPDGRLLRDAVAADPVGWLGPEHVAAFGADPALLVKLLDAGERLPVHVHPPDPFAREQCGSRFGKTEAWLVLAVEDAGAAVHVGFAGEVADPTLARWVSDQDRDALLGALNRVAVAPGDAVFVPAGLPHAIGAGVFLVELQQPTDLSVLLEWRGFAPDAAHGLLGMDTGRALGCVDRSSWGDGRWESLVRRNPDGDLFGPQAAPFFRAERLRDGGPVELDPSYSVLVVLGGAGELAPERGAPLPLRRGATVVIPHVAGRCTLSGGVDAVRCRPPAPASR